MIVHITLQQLEFFCAVARNLSFSKAAEELYTSQPYVSNQIRKLEDYFGVPLFLRSRPRISLTEPGTALYEQIDSILDDIGQLDALVQEFLGLQRGSVHLAATASAGNHVMPGLIASFNAEHPDVVVHARVGNTDDVVAWLDHNVDIGVSPQEPEGSNLKSEPFYRERLIVIFPISMNLPDPVPPEQLASLPKVVREGGSLTRARMYELIGDYPSGKEFVAQLGGTTAVNEAVAAGLGISIVPERSARAWLEAGSVGQSRIEGKDAYHEFNLFYSEHRYLTPAARAFIDHVHRTIDI